MSIIATYQNHKVKVLDVYELKDGKKASVQALDGTPFVGGDKWPIPTAYAIVPADELESVEELQPNRNGKKLLDLALNQERPQWCSSESVWIWGDNKRGAFLKEGEGHVCLCLVGVRESCPVFWLDPYKGWEVVPNVTNLYNRWVEKVR